MSNESTEDDDVNPNLLYMDKATPKPIQNNYRNKYSVSQSKVEDIPDKYEPFAIVAFISAITVFPLNILSVLLGTIFGHIALKRIRNNNRKGKKLAVAALVISYGAVLVFVIIFFISLYIAVRNPNIVNNKYF